MSSDARQILDLVAGVRARWRRLIVLRGAVRAALAASAVLATALVAGSLLARSAPALAVLAVLALIALAAATAWGLWPAREAPSDARVARFIEEADRSLDDRLVSAVDVLGRPAGAAETLAGPMLADAHHRTAHVKPSAIVPGRLIGRAGLQTMVAVLLVAAIAFVGRETARRSVDALSFTMFPGRTSLQVTPGSTRIALGAPLTIEARLRGSTAPVLVQLLRTEEAVDAGLSADEERWSVTDMPLAAAGAHAITIDRVERSFSYRIAAGGLTSSTFDVIVARPPRVTRVDVEYTYPQELGLEPHVEEDSGDIYAPADTRVKLRVHTLGDDVRGHLALGDGSTVDLLPEEAALSAGLAVTTDGSYRIALRDAGGLTTPGDTEYFIRVVEDRPPDVRVLRPARDREVTPLEEVEIEAAATDDHGIDRFELVYTVAGGNERVAPFRFTPGATSVSGDQLLFLEDLDVAPGDFVSYYVRARDRGRGRQGLESRSDIFFLQVKPFEQQFRLAQSQAMGGGSADRSIDELVAAQKEIIVATWQLDRRSRTAGGQRSDEDVRAVSRAEAELKTRVEQTSGALRATSLRNPRRRPGIGPPQPAPPGAGQASAEEDALTAAAVAMGRAVTALDRLSTSAAMPPELEALTHLLKARGEVTERQIVQQQAGSGAGSNRAGEDLSGLFDRELQRLQQTNYETPGTTNEREQESGNTLDRVRELARRQDELLRRQEELERARLDDETRRRELERLTREQAALRQRAEQLAREMTSREQAGTRRQESSGGGAGSGSQQGRQQPGSELRAASEEMRGAATELTRQDSAGAQARGARALERLREVERQLEAASPEGRRRALGDLQLEARQLAEAERDVGDTLERLSGGDTAGDALRRLAGDQDRLTARARRLQAALEAQGNSSGGDPRETEFQRAAGDAGRSLERQEVIERMDRLAEAMREMSRGSPENQRGSAPDGTRGPDMVGLQRDANTAGRALESLADRLGDAVGSLPPGRLGDQLAQARQLRDRMESIAGELERLDRRASETPRATDSGRGGQGDTAGQAGGDQAGATAEAASLQNEYNQRVRETRQLLEQLRRDDPGVVPGGVGVTFEGQGMVLSAPGTEAFKQDFATWDALRRQVTQALEQAEEALSRKASAQSARERLAVGVDDRPPADYRQQVDDYFKALAGGGRR